MENDPDDTEVDICGVFEHAKTSRHSDLSYHLFRSGLSRLVDV